MKIFSGKLRRAGSMELSINAIVILVLAITMLGLGIAFTKRMFTKFGQTLYVPEPDLPASAEEPIVTPSGDQISVQRAKATALTIQIYNSFETAPIVPFLTCGTYQVQGEPQNVDSGTDKTFRIIISQNSLPEGLVVCTIQSVHAVQGPIASTQITFDVR
ncbi:hypothetical protein JW968_02575 [Candidatus Woesearchaeota archaeon]|nr:hypothetical protein [Candidatus Woesearchaeota archaeon]